MIVPVAITSVMYAVLSVTHPLKSVDPAIGNMIKEGFVLKPVLLLPVLVMIVLPLFKVNLKITALMSILFSAVLAIAFQGEDPFVFARSLVLGYEADTANLSRIFAGGGMISMANICGVIFISCAYSQIIKETGMFGDIIRLMSRGCRRIGRVYRTLITGTFFSGLFCSGSAAIIMSSMLLDDAYEKTGGDKQELAIDIENTAELTATWVPWSAACMAAFSAMACPSSALIYSFFVFVLPVWHILTKTFARKKAKCYNEPVHAA
jgi:NhaC family Na+:H+ antiporter